MAKGAALCWLEDLQPFDHSEMLLAKGGDLSSALQSGCCDDDIVIADHFAGHFQFRPDTRVFICGLLGVRNDWQGIQNCLEVLLPFGPVGPDGTLHSVPKLCNGNGGDFKSIVRS